MNCCAADLRSFGFTTTSGSNIDIDTGVTMRVYDNKEGNVYSCYFTDMIADTEYICDTDEMVIVSHSNNDYNNGYIEFEVDSFLVSAAEQTPLQCEFYKFEQVSLAVNQLIDSNIFVGESMRIEFEIKIESACTAASWCQILIIGDENTHIQAPAIFVRGESLQNNNIMVAFSDQTDWNSNFETSGFNLPFGDDIWHQMYVELTARSRKVFFDNVLIYDGSGTFAAKYVNQVTTLYMTQQYSNYAALDAVVRKLCIDSAANAPAVISKAPSINNIITIDSVNINRNVAMAHFCWDKSSYATYMLYPNIMSCLYYNDNEVNKITADDTSTSSITINNEMRLSFEIKMNSIMASGNNKCEIVKIGSSTDLQVQAPSIKIRSIQDSIYTFEIAFSDQTNWNSNFVVSGGFSLPSQDNIWHKVYIELTATQRLFIFDDQVYHFEQGTFNGLHTQEKHSIIVNTNEENCIDARIRRLCINGPAANTIMNALATPKPWSECGVGSVGDESFIIGGDSGIHLIRMSEKQSVIQGANSDVYPYWATSIKDIQIYTENPSSNVLLIELCWNGLEYLCKLYPNSVAIHSCHASTDGIISHGNSCQTKEANINYWITFIFDSGASTDNLVINNITITVFSSITGADREFIVDSFCIPDLYAEFGYTHFTPAISCNTFRYNDNEWYLRPYIWFDINIPAITKQMIQFDSKIIVSHLAHLSDTIESVTLEGLINAGSKYVLILIQCPPPLTYGTETVGVLIRGSNGNMQRQQLTLTAGLRIQTFNLGLDFIGGIHNIEIEMESISAAVCISSLVIEYTSTTPYLSPHSFTEKYKFDKYHFSEHGTMIRDSCGTPWRVINGVWIRCYDGRLVITSNMEYSYVTLNMHVCNGLHTGLDDMWQDKLIMSIFGYDAENKITATEFMSLETPESWIDNAKRKFSISVPTIKQVNGIILTNNNDNKVLCLDYVRINEKSAFLTDHWLGTPGISCEGRGACVRTISAVLEWPICAVEITAVVYEAQNDYSADDVIFATSQCINDNRLISVDCGIAQEYSVYEEVSWTHEIGTEIGSSTSIEQGSSVEVSKSNEETVSATVSASTTGKAGVSIKGVFEVGGEITKSASATASETVTRSTTKSRTFAMTQAMSSNVIQMTTDGTVNGEAESITCSGSFTLPPLQSVEYNLIMRREILTINTFTDIKLTKCSYLFDTSTQLENEKENEDHFIYLYGVAGKFVSDKGTACSVMFETSRPRKQNPLTCGEEREIAARQYGTYVPMCDPNNNDIYDACQCSYGDSLTLPTCACVDVSSGNMMPHLSASLVDGGDWKTWCQDNCYAPINIPQAVVNRNVHVIADADPAIYPDSDPDPHYDPQITVVVNIDAKFVYLGYAFLALFGVYVLYNVLRGCKVKQHENVFKYSKVSQKSENEDKDIPEMI